MTNRRCLVAGLFLGLVVLIWLGIQFRTPPAVNHAETSGVATYKWASADNPPTDEEWDLFRQMKGKSSKELKVLFGITTAISHREWRGQNVTEWIYPWEACTYALIDENGIVVEAYVDSGY